MPAPRRSAGAVEGSVKLFASQCRQFLAGAAGGCAAAEVKTEAATPARPIWPNCIWSAAEASLLKRRSAAAAGGAAVAVGGGEVVFEGAAGWAGGEAGEGRAAGFAAATAAVLAFASTTGALASLAPSVAGSLKTSALSAVFAAAAEPPAAAAAAAA
jgi:hypothetical protein